MTNNQASRILKYTHSENGLHFVELSFCQARNGNKANCSFFKWKFRPRGWNSCSGGPLLRAIGAPAETSVW